MTDQRTQNTQPQHYLTLRGGRMTKLGKQAASYAPTLGMASSWFLSSASSVAIGAALFFGGAPSANAGTCSVVAAGQVSCSGPANSGTDTTRGFISLGPEGLTVTTEPNFGLTTTLGNGFFLNDSGTGDLTFTDNNMSIITAPSVGLYMRNYNGGSLSLTTNGSVTGTGLDGINAINGYGGTGLTISANNVYGGRHGVYARNDGTGDLSVTTTGTVRGLSSNGISAINGRSEGQYYYEGEGENTGPRSVSVTANGDVTGGNNGIYVSNFGTGGITVNATGVNVTGQRGAGIRTINSIYDRLDSTVVNGPGVGMTTMGAVDGIYSTNAAGSLTINALGTSIGQARDGIRGYNNLGATDFTISSGTATGQERGINARNYGAGFLSITSTTNATGTDEEGIYALNAGNGTSLTISAAAATGYYNGINAQNYGTGALSITATGQVTGRYGNGVLAYNSSGTMGATIKVADVTGGGYGIDAHHYGYGVLSVTSTGMLVGQSGAGIHAYAYGNSTGLMVTTNNVVGYTDGIYAENLAGGATSITASGTTYAAVSNGIYAISTNTTTSMTIEAGNVSGGTYGIYADHLGTAGLTIKATGNVEGRNGSGIFAVNSANDVSGSMYIGAPTAGNTVTGAIHGIYADNSGGSLTINALGTTIGTAGSGIIATNNPGTTSLSITAGSVTGNSMGIDARNFGSGSLSVTATGMVAGTAAFGINASNSANGTDLTVNAADVSGTYGIVARNNGSGSVSVTTTGMVTGTASEGIEAFNFMNGTDVTVNAANVTGDRNGIYATNYGTGTLSVTVSGDVMGGSGTGINTRNVLGQMTNITLEPTATVSALSGRAISNNESDSLTTLNGAKVTGSIILGDGSDDLTLTGVVDTSAITLLDGGDDTSAADGFIDSFLLLNATVNMDASILQNWETISAINSIAVLNDLNTPLLNVCGGSTTLAGNSAVSNVLGCASDDTIIATDNTTVADVIEGAGGADNIQVLGAASVTTGVFGGGSGQDASAASDGNDMITVNTTGTVGLIDGGAGDDGISLLNGTVGSVLGQTGDDTFTWSGGAIMGFNGGDGSDAANVTAAGGLTQMLDGGDDTSSADGFVDTLTLSGYTAALTGANYLNWENVVIDGGTVSFADAALTTGADMGTGLRLANAARLQAAENLAITGNMTVDSGTVFEDLVAGNSAHMISGSLTNNGTVDLADGSTGDVLNIGGDFSGAGTFMLDVDLTGDVSDMLTIGGSATGSGAMLAFNDASTGLASGNSILVADIAGTSTSDAFALSGDLISGAFSYQLVLNGSDWYLAPGASAISAEYEALPVAMARLHDLSSYRERTAGRNFLTGGGNNGAQATRSAAGAPPSNHQTGTWFRFVGEEADITPDSSTSGLSFDSSLRKIEVGVASKIAEYGNGDLTASLSLFDGSIDLDTFTQFGPGMVNVDGRGILATLTWNGFDGTYVDTQLQFSEFEANTSNANAIGGDGRAFSVEAGKAFDWKDGWILTPQAQLVWSDLDIDSFTGANNEQVSLVDGETTRLRVGLEASKAWSDATGGHGHFYGTLNLHHQIDGDTAVQVSTLNLNTSMEKLSAEISVGGNYSWNNDQYGIFGHVSAERSFDTGSHSIGGTFGFKLQF